ncbi:MAG: hypothetical protein ACW99L_00035 [Promethearchaeota archaeon]|jgi:hypothetical protein
MQLYNLDEKGEIVKIEKLEFHENDVYLVDDEDKNTIYIWVGISVLQEKKDITAEVARKLDKERGGSAKILIMKQKREYGSFLAMMNDLKKGLIPGETIERRPEFIFEMPIEKIRSIGLDGTPEKRELTVEERIRAWLKQSQEHRTFIERPKEEKTPEITKFVKIENDATEEVVKETLHYEEPVDQEEIYEEVEYVKEEEEAFEEIDFKTQVREAAYFLSLSKYSYNDLCWILSEKIQKMSLDMPSIEDIKRKAEEVFNSSCTYDELCWLNAEMDFLIKKSFLEKEKKTFNY